MQPHEYEFLRHKMVERLEKEGIRDQRLLEAMRTIRRHIFVDEAVRGQAYEDHAVPIGLQQTISQPFVVARMTELLELRPDHRVMEVGTGSGYQTAILAFLAGEVYSIERISSLMEIAERLLANLGFSNVRFRLGDGTCGWPEHAPYDGVLLTAAAPRVPEPLLEQLRVGGRLVLPLGDEEHQRLKRLIKGEGREHRMEDHGGCVFVKLVGKYGFQDRGHD